MEQMDMSEYCQHINEASVGRLIQQFCDLESNADLLRAKIQQRLNQCRAVLDQQYQLIVHAAVPSSVVQKSNDEHETISDNVPGLEVRNVRHQSR